MSRLESCGSLSRLDGAGLQERARGPRAYGGDGAGGPRAGPAGERLENKGGGGGVSRLESCGSLSKLDVAGWQERARGAAGGAAGVWRGWGRLENKEGEGWNCCVCRGGIR